MAFLVGDGPEFIYTQYHSLLRLVLNITYTIYNVLFYNVSWMANQISTESVFCVRTEHDPRPTLALWEYNLESSHII